MVQITKMSTNKIRHAYSYLLICSFLLFLFTTPLTEVSAKPAKASKAIRTATPVEVADEALWHMNYPKADSLYCLELRNNPGNADLNWKMARLQVSLGEAVPPGNKDARMQHYHKAAEYARTCITLDSLNSNGHTWLAASLGLMADKTGTKEKLKRAKEVKHELDTALRLNPNDETALSILGSYYREAAKIGWFKRMIGNAFLGEVPKGDYTLSEKAFRKAISIDSRIIRNYHELALICIDSGNKEEAITLMKTALEKPILFETDKIRIEQMRTLLKKLTTE